MLQIPSAKKKPTSQCTGELSIMEVLLPQNPQRSTASFFFNLGSSFPREFFVYARPYAPILRGSWWGAYVTQYTGSVLLADHNAQQHNSRSLRAFVFKALWNRQTGTCASSLKTMVNNCNVMTPPLGMQVHEPQINFSLIAIKRPSSWSSRKPIHRMKSKSQCLSAWIRCLVCD